MVNHQLHADDSQALEQNVVVGLCIVKMMKKGTNDKISMYFQIVYNIWRQHSHFLLSIKRMINIFLQIYLIRRKI